MVPARCNAQIHTHTHTHSFELDKEKVTDARSGHKHAMVSLRNPGCLDGLVITTSMPTAQGQMHLVETRQLLDKGHVHAQVTTGRAVGRKHMELGGGGWTRGTCTRQVQQRRW